MQSDVSNNAYGNSDLYCYWQDKEFGKMRILVANTFGSIMTVLVFTVLTEVMVLP